MAAALSPLTVGVAIATLAVLVYDTLSIRIERLSGMLDRLGAETIDAIAMSNPAPSAPTLRTATSHLLDQEAHSGHSPGVPAAHLARTTHQAPHHRQPAGDPQYQRTVGIHDIGF